MKKPGTKTRAAKIPRAFVTILDRDLSRLRENILAGYDGKYTVAKNGCLILAGTDVRSISFD